MRKGILRDESRRPGGNRLGKPMFTARSVEDVPKIVVWLRSLAAERDVGIELCVGGPRDSECTEAYSVTEEILGKMFDETDVD